METEVEWLLVRVKVAYFALARDLAGKSEEEISLVAAPDVEHLLSEVFNVHPKLREMRQITRTLVNGRVILGNVELRDGDHVTLLPAVGGG